MNTPLDPERLARTRDVLKSAGLDAFVCSLPRNVLLLTGYWPVIGTSVAIVTADGAAHLIVPEDEAALASSAAIPLTTFAPGSLEDLTSPIAQLRASLFSVMRKLSLTNASIGVDCDAATVPAPYSAMHLYGVTLRDAIAQEFPQTALHPSSDLLNRLAARLTPHELGRLRMAAKIAGESFEQIRFVLQPGRTEAEIAARMAALLATSPLARAMDRAGGFAWCMSGPNSFEAYFAFAYTRHRELRRGDLALLHCNSQALGLWTDITRTFVLGPSTAQQSAIYQSILNARDAALAAIKPGVTGAQVDRAARDVISKDGYATAFKHGTGHGVGFGAISGGNYPRIHPASPDVLEEGMVFNVEPAIYIEGFGGVRQCEMVTVIANGAELLTPFLHTLSDLVITD